MNNRKYPLCHLQSILRCTHTPFHHWLFPITGRLPSLAGSHHWLLSQLLLRSQAFSITGSPPPLAFLTTASSLTGRIPTLTDIPHWPTSHTGRLLTLADFSHWPTSHTGRLPTLADFPHWLTSLTGRLPPLTSSITAFLPPLAPSHHVRAIRGGVPHADMYIVNAGTHASVVVSPVNHVIVFHVISFTC